MKLLCFLLLLLTIPASAQKKRRSDKTSLPERGSHIRRPDNALFTGDWLWTENGDSIRIFLRTETVYVKPLDMKLDVLLGYYRHTRGDSVVADTYQYRHTPETDHHYTFYLSASQGNLKGTVSRKNSPAHARITCVADAWRQSFVVYLLPPEMYLATDGSLHEIIPNKLRFRRIG
ncbi:DUF6705 family protein [Siphonobacter aquaeclarae]|uniref:DUF6705 domain-containing protein n=1 Tax=Siphonobacter aquaeclarae TaxID=563176 RepID=A0A1G9PF26_9BACT|nr:DUF6705 family protein [Siphonobacter aquaeclarae]SDL97368.1 hypothetical protein SAMN04488090_2154 [Siphonobacter aquaeclarae]